MFSLPSKIATLPCLLIGLSACIAPQATQEQTQVETIVFSGLSRISPPAPLLEKKTDSQKPNMVIWHPGYWQQDGTNFTWLPGYYMDRPAQAATW